MNAESALGYGLLVETVVPGRGNTLRVSMKKMPTRGRFLVVQGSTAGTAVYRVEAVDDDVVTVDRTIVWPFQKGDCVTGLALPPRIDAHFDPDGVIRGTFTPDVPAESGRGWVTR